MESGSQFGLIKEYYEELERDPESPIFVALADAYREGGLLDEALAVCQRGLKVHPTYAAAHLVLGQIYMDMNMLEPAEQEISLALQLDPKNALALAALGLVHALTGRMESAVRYLDHAHFLNPDDAQIANYLEEAKRAADQESGGSRSRKTAPQATETPSLSEAAISRIDQFLQDILQMEGVDAALLIDSNGQHGTTAGVGHLLDESLGRSIVSISNRTSEYVPELFGSLQQMLLEGSDGSVFTARVECDFIGVVLSAAGQPGSVALSIEDFMAQKGEGNG